MSDDQKPEWPETSNDWARLGALANWIDGSIDEKSPSRIATAFEAWQETSFKPFDDNHLMTRAEKALLVRALDGGKDRWKAMALHLRSGAASPKFVNLVAHLIEHNAFAPNADLSQRPLLGVFEDWQLINIILRHHYPEDVARVGAAFERIASRLVAILRGEKASAGHPYADRERYEENAANIEKQMKKGRSESYMLGVLVGHIRRAPTSD
ncbi:hypothetical protein [Sinorhizobium fredii]|uniref:hypothetical protein n=1 Tax=Rhizobium fredii TaxID=380 RepID=UPI0004B11F84|nr:hypothetical protein [Sinorhizobium fredii]